MKKFLFISPNSITGAQLELARQAGIDLARCGDEDAFTIDPRNMLDRDESDDLWGFVVDHPAAAMRLLAENYEIGVFENGNRAAPDESPRFEAVALHIFSGLGSFDLDQKVVRL